MIDMKTRPEFLRELRNYMLHERAIKAAYLDGSIDSYLLADFFSASGAVKKALSKA